MNHKKIYIMLVAGMTMFSLSVIFDLGTVKAQDASSSLAVSIPHVTKVSDVRGLDYDDIGFSNGSHSWTGGLEPWLQAANGTYVPYIISSNSTHVFFDSKQYPFAINKNTCVVTVYDISTKIAQNPVVVIGKDYWNYGYKTPTSQAYAIVDTSSLACTFTQTTNSSGYFAQAVKSDSNVQLSVTYSKKINQPFETFVTLTNMNSALNGDNFESVEQMNQISLNALNTHVTTANPEMTTPVPDGIIKMPHDALVKSNIQFKNKVNNMLQLDFTKTPYFSQMTGTKSLGMVSTTFEFGRNQSALSSGQSTTLDPTYGYVTMASKRVFNGAGTNSASCPSTADSSDNYAYLRLDPAGAGYTCTLLSYRWDISSIPSNSTITSASLRTTVTSVSSPNNCDWAEIADDPNVASVNALYNDIRTGTRWLANDATCTTVQTNAVIPISSAGVTDIQNHLAGHWWATGIDENPETRTSVQHQIVFGGNAGDQNVALQVNYVAGGGGGGGGGTGITSINGDTTSAQTIRGVTGNTTVSTSAGTTTVNLGSNALVKGGDITNTKTSGTFRITAQPGVAICIGTGC